MSVKELEKETRVWNYKTEAHTGEPPLYVKRNLEAQVNAVDIKLTYGPDLKRRGKRGQKHDRVVEGPMGTG